MFPEEAVLPILAGAVAFFATAIAVQVAPQLIAFVVENWN